MLAYYGGFRHNMGNLSKSCEGFKQVMWRMQAHCGGWRHNEGNLRMLWECKHVIRMHIMGYRYVVGESTLSWEMQYYYVDSGKFLGMHA